jgi:hypothetical protein
MAHVRPTLADFHIYENEVVHLPTNASWVAYPGKADVKTFNPGLLGTALPNGDVYSESEVIEMALRLLRDRLAGSYG